MRVAIDGTYFGVLPGLNTEQLIRRAVDSGAEGLNWPFHEAFGSADPAEVARQLSDAGQSAVTLGLTSHTSAAPGLEQEFRDHLVRALEAAQALDTRLLDAWPRRPQDVSKSLAQDTLRANLEFAVPLLQQANCTLSLEFEPDTTLERYPEALDFLVPFAPHVKITADTYHVVRIDDSLPSAAAALGQHLAVIHFSASHRGEPGSAGDTCDYAGFLDAALSAGYAGDLVLQYKPEGEALDSLKRAVAFTRAIIAATAATH